MESSRFTGEHMSSSSSEKTRLRDVLCSSELLDQPSNELLQTAVSHAETRTYDQDQTLYESGDAAKQVFVVMDGQIELIRTLSGEREARCRMKQGDLFGLLSAVTTSARRSHARVVSNELTVACVDYEQLIDAIEEKSDLRTFMEGLFKHLEKRIDRTSEVIETLV